MSKRKKIKTEMPDEIQQLGPLLLARSGNTIFMKNTMSSEQFNDFMKKAAAEYPRQCQEIDRLVAEIKESITTFEPLTLLHCGYYHFASSAAGKKSEVQFDSDDAIALRMLDYVQSVIVSSPLSATRSDQFDQNRWLQLKEKITNLYSQLILTFQIVDTAYQRVNDAKYVQELDDFRKQAQMMWIGVRGKRYAIHDQPHLRDILGPHENILQELFGISTNALLRGLEAIHNSLTRGLSQVVEELHDFRDKSLKSLEHKISEDTTEEQLPLLMKEVVKDEGWEAWHASISGRLFGFDLFDVGKLTGWPNQFLRELAFEPGEDHDFFSQGQYAGWPLRILPIQKRPFLKIGASYYCFDLLSLEDNIYRVLQRLIFRLKPEYKPSWNERQKQISENLPFRLLGRILPKATCYKNVNFEWKSGKSGEKNWCETDGLMIYGDHLIVIEVKAGAFTYTSPATDFNSYLNSIKDLVLKPAEQAKRFLDYLKSNDEVVIFDDNHEEIARLQHKHFRHITACCVTLDGLTTMATQEQSLKILKEHPEDFPVWSISIDDLRVYSDIFDNGICFLHFLEERQRAFRTPSLDHTDEITHLALYFTYNRYADVAHEYGDVHQLGWHGFHEEIDAYFYDLLVTPNAAKKPDQKLPKTFKRIINLLTEQSKDGHCKVGCYLLNLSGETRNALSTHVENAFDLQLQKKRTLPFSFFGETKITVFCLQDAIEAPSKEWMCDYVLATLFRAQEDQRLMLIIRYNENRKIIDIEFAFWHKEDISSDRLSIIKTLSEEYAESRLKSYMRQSRKSKVGRNELCPCGSGKKYKRCCDRKLKTP